MEPGPTLPLYWMNIRSRPELLGGVIIGAMAILLVIGCAIFVGVANRPAPLGTPLDSASRAGSVARRSADQPLTGDALTAALLKPLEAQPISRDNAIAYNASIPISTEPNPAATTFLLNKATPVDIQRATDCLTAAIYFESATEPVAGQRAVAQVVLNRVRHFAYPKTVCGVVFQGSDRPTGCQFTFTCDGSLARPLDRKLWDRARLVALAALGGHVEPSIGWATHYHAIYVAPYWQPSLLKVAVVGLHVFYRGIGTWGQRPSFTAQYAGQEPDIAAMAVLVPPAIPVAPAVDAIITVPAVTTDQARAFVPQRDADLAPVLQNLEPSAPKPSAAATPLPATKPTPTFAAPRAPSRPRLPL